MRVLLLLAATLGLVMGENEYGVDCSFPQHYFNASSSSCGNLGDRMQVYKDYVKGCREYYEEDADFCNEEEQERLCENRERPQYVINYTDTGYTKLQVPDEIWKPIYSYWLKYRGDLEVEHEDDGASINYWDGRTYMAQMFGRRESKELRDQVFDTVKRELERWTGVEQRPISLYGIRVYRSGAILAPHLDRYPLVSSVIINVDQDVEEPWPLEVIGRDGKAHNVTLEPGQMALYESHSLVHGRPFALKGKYMANMFCHFEPTGRLIDEEGNYYWKNGIIVQDIPPYIVRGSPQEAEWRSEYPDGWEYEAPEYEGGDGEEDWEEDEDYEDEDYWEEDYAGEDEEEEYEEENDYAEEEEL